MPATSAKQWRFMKAVQSGAVKVKGLSSEKAKEFADSTPKELRKPKSKGAR
jgi:hypothetical protein